MLDNETVEALKAEGSEKMIEFAPKFAATIFMDAVSATMNQVVQILPTMMQQFSNQQAHNQKYEDAFHSFWDQRGFDLREHGNELAAIGSAYRNANPQAKPEDVITNIGAQLILAKQLAPRAGVSIIPGNGNGTPAVAAVQTPAFSSAATAQG